MRVNISCMWHNNVILLPGLVDQVAVILVLLLSLSTALPLGVFLI